MGPSNNGALIAQMQETMQRRMKAFQDIYSAPINKEEEEGEEEEGEEGGGRKSYKLRCI